MIKAIIFDMDGTILNTEPVYETANKTWIFEKYGIKLNQDDLDSQKGLRDEDEFNNYKIKYLIKDSIEIMKVDRNDYFFKIAKNFDIVIDKDSIKLRSLSESYLLALTTSTDGDKFSYETKFFDLNLFSVIITGADVNNGKPDSECYDKTISKLGVKPFECVIIEDAVNGIIAGKKSGAFCIGVLGSFSKEELILAGADVVVKNILDINENIIIKLGESVCVE